jgi:hypothetical protein
MHVVYNAANRQSGDCADANGNISSSGSCYFNPYTYDVENRIVAVREECSTPTLRGTNACGEEWSHKIPIRGSPLSLSTKLLFGA